MNNFREAILIPREVIEAAPELLTPIVKAAQKAGVDWAEMVAGGMGGAEEVADAGRYGDTELAHVNPQEAAMLQAGGGAGTINPQTGLREFYGYDSGPSDRGPGRSNDRDNDIGGGSGGDNRNERSNTSYAGGGPTGGSRSDYGRSPNVSGPQGNPGASGGDVDRAPALYGDTRGGGLVYDPANITAAPGTQGSGTATEWGGVNQQVAGNVFVGPDGKTYRSTGPAGINALGAVGGILPGPFGAPFNAAGQAMGMENLVDLGYGRVEIDPVTGIDIVGHNDTPDPRPQLSGGFRQETFATPPPRWTRPTEMSPSARFGFEPGMTPFQQRVAIASRGTSGLDSFFRSQDAQDYYSNLLQRALIFDDGTLGELGELRPIENAYLDLMGYGPRTTTEGLLEALAGG